MLPTSRLDFGLPLMSNVKRQVRIEECDVPASSVIDRRIIGAAFFRHSYRMALTHAQIGVVEIFFAIFGHHPPWMQRLLIARNQIAILCGLDAPTPAEIMNPEVKSSYAVGDKIGPWPIFNLTPGELVAGLYNKHLDFRLSVVKEKNGAVTSAAIFTVCTTHNAFEKVYLSFINAFPKRGVRYLIQKAVAAGRL